jgi:hypothetical protein
MDNKKLVFKVRVNVVSTVYTTDSHLNTFFKEYFKEPSPKLIKVCTLYSTYIYVQLYSQRVCRASRD